jgi:hypothetical protein
MMAIFLGPPSIFSPPIVGSALYPFASFPVLECCKASSRAASAMSLPASIAMFSTCCESRNAAIETLSGR